MLVYLEDQDLSGDQTQMMVYSKDTASFYIDANGKDYTCNYLTRAVSSPTSHLGKEVLSCGVSRVACLVWRVSCC